jgi:tetratricopeptide (TPR) repeat protein
VGFYISYPFAYTFLIAPMLIVLRLITFAIGGNLPMGKLFAHLIVLFMSVVFISGGDPILFLLNFISKKIKPDFTLVPIKKYPIFTPQLLIFVLKDDLIEKDDFQENTESFEQTNDQQTEGNDQQNLSPVCKSGMIKFIKKDYQGAIIDYNEAIRCEPNQNQYYYYRAKTYQFMGDFQNALNDLAQCFNLDSQSYQNNDEYYWDIGVCHQRLNNHQAAIRNFDHCLMLNPQNDSAYWMRGTTYSALGKYQEAIADCNYALQINPNNANVYALRSLAKANLNDKEGCRQDYQIAMQMAGSDPELQPLFQNITNYLAKS